MPDNRSNKTSTAEGPEGCRNRETLGARESLVTAEGPGKAGAPSMTTPTPITALAQSQGWKLRVCFLALMTC